MYNSLNYEIRIIVLCPHHYDMFLNCLGVLLIEFLACFAELKNARYPLLSKLISCKILFLIEFYFDLISLLFFLLIFTHQPINEYQLTLVGITSIFMKIHLIRHAKADPSAASGKDYDRKLSPKGIVQVNVLGLFLHDLNIKPEIIFCSSAARTRETLSIIHHKISLGKITYFEDLYLCDREIYLSKIWELKNKKELLIVGHNDGISALATYLSDEPFMMKTGEYTCIEFNVDSWQEVSRGTGSIIAQFRPSVFLPD